MHDLKKFDYASFLNKYYPDSEKISTSAHLNLSDLLPFSLPYTPLRSSTFHIYFYAARHDFTTSYSNFIALYPRAPHLAPFVITQQYEYILPTYLLTNYSYGPMFTIFNSPGIAAIKLYDTFNTKFIKSLTVPFSSDVIIKSNSNLYFINYMSKMLRAHDDFKITFDSIILSDEDLPIGYPRLLAVDQILLLPMYCEIRLLMTSNDVIHSWALPAYGIKMDAVPGRLNQVPFEACFMGTN